MTTVEVILVIEVISTLEVRLFIKKKISSIFIHSPFPNFLKPKFPWFFQGKFEDFLNFHFKLPIHIFGPICKTFVKIPN